MGAKLASSLGYCGRSVDVKGWPDISLTLQLKIVNQCLLLRLGNLQLLPCGTSWWSRSHYICY